MRKEKQSLQLTAWPIQLLLLLLLLLLQPISAVVADLPSPPTLNGSHFRFTVVQTDEGWVNIEEIDDYDDSAGFSGRYNITGYCIDIIREVANLANFSYELLPPSGFGSLCKHNEDGSKDEGDQVAIEAYGKQYRGQYLCAQSDVQEDYTEKNRSQHNTDLFQSLFYITPERLLLNRFSVPFVPPTVGNFQLYGIAIRVRDIQDYIRQQKDGLVGKVCLHDNTADTLFALKTFPDLEYELVYDGFAPAQVHAALESSKCDTFFGAYPQATQNIMLMSRRGLCKARGMPIGLVGSPLEYGYGHFAMGIRHQLDYSVDHALNYWMASLMSCSPGQEEGQCSWNFASGYRDIGGEEGLECKYVAFPPGESPIPIGTIVGIGLGVFALIAALVVAGYLFVDHYRRQHRIRKRFVQQLARYIEIGNSPEDMTASKLSDMFQYISGEDSAKFTEEDFLKWMMDIHLPFLSDRDLKQLWSELDSLTNNHLVSPIEFVMFLQTCEREFRIVRAELKAMPKLERLKLTVRRLSSISIDGEQVVRRREHEMNKSGRTVLTS